MFFGQPEALLPLLQSLEKHLGCLSGDDNSHRSHRVCVLPCCVEAAGQTKSIRWSKRLFWQRRKTKMVAPSDSHCC
jgi:hypothetical protein